MLDARAGSLPDCAAASLDGPPCGARERAADVTRVGNMGDLARAKEAEENLTCDPEPEHPPDRYADLDESRVADGAPAPEREAEADTGKRERVVGEQAGDRAGCSHGGHRGSA